jgi:hypothetical protein
VAVSPLTLTAPGGLLLERLPDRLFGPLASANRHRYWALLCLLHQRRFGPDAPMPPVHGFPVREIVHDIEEDLAAQDAWDDEGGESAAETPLGIRAIGVFNRLRDAGWFRVDRHGVREMVTMRPAVAQFMDRLVEFAQTGPVFVSGKVRSIDLNLQAVKRNEANGESLVEAAQQARQLLENVRNTGTNVRDLMDSLSAETTTRAYVKRFFADYVQRVFIADYRELRTRDHPLSRRPQILRTVNEIQSSAEQRKRLLTWYEANLCKGDPDRAQRLFERDIQRLQDIARIDEYLERLDDEIRRANKRALAYLDYRLRSLRPIGQLVDHAMRTVLAHHDATSAAPFAPSTLVGPALLAEPRQANDRPPATALRKTLVSMEEMARTALRLRAREARTVTPAKLAAYLQRQLAGKTALNGAELHIDSVADFRALQTLMSLAAANRSGDRALRLAALSMARGYRVAFTDTEEQPGPYLSSRPFDVRVHDKTASTTKESP